MNRYTYETNSYSKMILREAKRMLEKQQKEHEPLLKAFKKKQLLKQQKER